MRRYRSLGGRASRRTTAVTVNRDDHGRGTISSGTRRLPERVQGQAVDFRFYARAASLSAGLLRHRVRDQSLDEYCPRRRNGDRPRAMETTARDAFQIE